MLLVNVISVGANWQNAFVHEANIGMDIYLTGDKDDAVQVEWSSGPPGPPGNRSRWSPVRVPRFLSTYISNNKMNVRI